MIPPRSVSGRHEARAGQERPLGTSEARGYLETLKTNAGALLRCTLRLLEPLSNRRDRPGNELCSNFLRCRKAPGANPQPQRSARYEQYRESQPRRLQPMSWASLTIWSRLLPTSSLVEI